MDQQSLLHAGVGGQNVTQARVESDCLDLFADVPAETAMRGNMTLNLSPVSAITDSGSVKFHINAVPNHYVDMSSAVLAGTICVKRVDLSTSEEHAVEVNNVSICNYFPAALFSSLDIDILGKSASKMTTPYSHLKMYLQTLLSYGKGAKDTHLAAAGWIMDEPGQFETFGSEACKQRGSLIEYSKQCDFAMPLNIDLFSLDKLLPDFLDIHITFHRNPHTIPLTTTKPGEPERADGMTDEEFKKVKEKYERAGTASYRIKILDLRLIMRQVLIDPGVVLRHQQKLAEKNSLMRYPLTRTEVKGLECMPPKTKQLNVNNLFTGRLPNSIIIGLLKSDALTGALGKNPFNFDNFGIKNIYLTVNQKRIPAEGYRPDFTTGNFAKAYYGLFENTGIHFSDRSNAISPDLFKSGCCLFAFDLSPDLCMNYHGHETKYGLITLHIELSKELTEAVTPICYSSYDDVFCINGDGMCFYEMAGGPK